MSAARRWLWPLGAAWGAGAATRAWAYRRGVLRRTRLRGTVISVGNLAVGGSGKTPVVALVASILQAAGCLVAILSRGYGGAFRGPALVVSDGARVDADAAAAGDEPVMLAWSLPGVIVAVGKRRDEVGRAVEARFGAVVHVLDDGFQHLRLERDLDVLCLQAGDLADRPLPAGRLREFASAARRAHVVLVAEGSSQAGLPEGRVFTLRRRVVGFAGLDGREGHPPRRVYLLSGIARPGRFAEDASTHGLDVVRHRAFPDHHRFTAADLRAASAEAEALGAEAILTTAKDAVRLPAGEARLPVLVLRIAAEVGDEARFRERLLAAVGRAH
ncbi:MAG TPA: tetraacyldisaccharide 4'-kinase [Vicinamibacteria bacterium]|nr:tetraacyldisaccharide 4'-kinase [Vicinamibacteria bacterium]